jgi:hypothetical protein
MAQTYCALLCRLCSALLLIALSFFAISCALTPADSDDDQLASSITELTFQAPAQTMHVRNFLVQDESTLGEMPGLIEDVATGIASFEPLDIQQCRDQVLLGPLEGRAPPFKLPA